MSLFCICLMCDGLELNRRCVRSERSSMCIGPDKKLPFLQAFQYAMAESLNRHHSEKFGKIIAKFLYTCYTGAEIDMNAQRKRASYHL